MMTIKVSPSDYLLIMQGLRDRMEKLQEMAKYEGMKEQVTPAIEQCDRLHKELMLNYLGKDDYNKLVAEGFFTTVCGWVM